jgi:DNA-binding NarL/FixJ family response regulator
MAVEFATVLLVDDEPMARAATCTILEGDAFVVVGESTGNSEALALAIRERPDICLIDVTTAEGGIRLVREVSSRLPETAVVILTGSERHVDLIDSIRAGAVGYLLKTMDPARLPAALRGVLAGEAAIPRGLMAHLVNELQTHGRRRVIAGSEGRAELSGREWEVLELMCDGLSGTQVADRLSLSPITVRRHLGEVIRKLGVSDRASAIALVKEQLDL